MGGGWIGGGWLIYIRVWVGGGGAGGGCHLIVFVFFLYFCILLYHVVSPFT